MIQAFDKTGVSLGFPNFIELQWNRRFNGFGDFVVYMPADLYNPDIKYIQNVDRPETGIVQKIVFEQKPEGDFVTISGNFIEALLDWGMLWRDKTYHATTAEGVRTRIRTIFRDAMTQTNAPSITNYTEMEFKPTNPQLYRVSIATTMPTPSEMDFILSKATPAGTAVLEWLNYNGYSMRGLPIFNTSRPGPYLGMNIETYTGTDRSGSVYFGKPYGDVSSVEYVLDESAERAEYLCIQSVSSSQAYSGVVTLTTSEGTKRYVAARTFEAANAPSDMNGAYPLGVIYTSGGNDTTVAQSTLAAQMRAEGRMAMLDTYKLETVSVDVLQNSFIYLTDYDLGDTVSIVIPELDLSFTAQIMEVHEVQSSNNLEVQIVLGTPRRKKRK